MPWLRRVQVMQQMETAECGLACLGMVLGYHGHQRSLRELRELVGTSRNGHSALSLLAAGRNLGMEGRGVSLGAKKLRELKTPAILHWKNNHFVVLERCQGERFIIVDPADGRRRVSQEEMQTSFSRVAIELTPGPEFSRRKGARRNLYRYYHLLCSQRRTLAFVVFANVVRHGLVVTAPVASQFLIDQVIAPDRQGWLWPTLAVLTLIAVAQLMLQYLHGLSESTLRLALGTSLAQQMGEHLLRLPLAFLSGRSHGDLLSRVNMQTALQELLAKTVQSLFDVLLVILLVSLMLNYDPMLGSVSLLLTISRIALVRLARRPMAQRVAAELAARGREGGAIAEATSAIEMTKGLSAERALANRFSRRVRERTVWSVGTGRIEAGLGEAMAAIDAVMLASILWLGGRQVIADEMALGVFAGFLAIRSMAEQPIGALVSIVENWLRVRGVLERCEDILGTEVEDVTKGAGNPVAGDIELVDVGFRFGAEPWMFRHLNLKVRAGEHLALTGASGQGKSTLLKLMCGLLEPTEGTVLVGGCDLKKVTHESLVRHCGVVLQEPLILEGSLREALSIRDPQATQEELSAAAKLACFDRVVEQLTHGYDSTLYAMGRNLSGGERQRLALAQALLGRPPVVFLDEGTSSLDPVTERGVLDNLATTGATVISVAHRRSAMLHADRILILDGCLYDCTEAIFSRSQNAGATQAAE